MDKDESVILYTREYVGRGKYQSIYCGKHNETEILIRTETVACNVGQALDMAKPRKGEIVLNTIPFPTSRVK